MSQYRFFGADTPAVKPIDPLYKKIGDQRHLYDLLSLCWKADTCAPRMREDWNESNKTLGQCSITAFLVQDIFGGKVYGIPLGKDTFHCFNEINGVVFDLTSEQFGNEELYYSLVFPQSREVHFAKKEKEERYLLLKSRLLDLLK